MKKALALAMAALLCASACAETLEIGDKGGRVLKVQEALYEKGYLDVEADGVYGGMTYEAVSEFQKDNGLEVTGEVDEKTEEMILANGESEVRLAQEKLIELGYLSGEADGVMGAATYGALGVFQRDNNLEVTGELDEATRELLLAEPEEVTEEVVAEEETSEEATEEVAEEAAEEEVVEEEAEEEEVVEEEPKSEVTLVQERLIELGYLLGEADGDFGGMSWEALYSFQKANGLEATGDIDEETKNVLFSENAKADEVRPVQARLILLGYMDGEPDGDFGPKTADAVYAFQEANDLPTTGAIDETTKEALFAEAAKADDVRRAQTRLIELGYLQGNADGIFGAKSLTAVKRFQTLNGLEATGELDEATLEAMASEDAVKVRPSLTYDSKGDAVKELQERLILFGFLNNGADGDFGDKTATAVIRFQEHLEKQGKAADLGIEATGVATSETQDILFSKDYSTYLKDVKQGDENFEVLRVERQLRNQGYMDAQPDEIMDEYAADCVKAVQTAAGLNATGVADQATMDVLFSKDAPKAEHYVAYDIAYGDEGNVVKDVQTALARMGMLSGSADGEYGDGVEAAIERMYEFLSKHNPEYAYYFEARGMITAEAQDVLRSADLEVYFEDIDEDASVSEISRAQRRLHNLMYLRSGGVDGDYGKTTKKAIEEFQENNKLPVTGIADEETQRVLYSDSAIGDWSQYKLEVDTGRQRVYAFELNEKGQYEKIHEFICSTGVGNSTPLGTFIETTEPLDRWHFFYTYNCWAQYAWRITGPYYFHSVIYSTRDESSIRMSSVYNLGSKASHGCVRLEVPAARWIYENCEAGTIVEIY